MTRPFRPRLALVALGAAALWPTSPGAHPHVFIDAGVHLVMENGHVTAVEVTWLYDELYTLILLEDYNLDPDFDMVLTEAERAQTLGFDLNWNSGFEGGLELMRGDTALELGPPEAVALELVEPGQFRTVHRRPVTDPAGEGPVSARAFDEAFFVAMEMTGEMAVTGAECDTTLIRPDLEAAFERRWEAIEAIGGEFAAEENFPAIGEWFADRVVFECAG